MEAECVCGRHFDKAFQVVKPSALEPHEMYKSFQRGLVQ